MSNHVTLGSTNKAIAFYLKWGALWGSNPRPSGPQPDALTS